MICTHNAVHELTAIDATALAYDVKGNLTTNSNGQTYVWDIENRLISAADNQNNTLGTYTYDALGRRVSKTVNGNTTVFVSDGLQEIAEYVVSVRKRPSTKWLEFMGGCAWEVTHGEKQCWRTAAVVGSTATRTGGALAEAPGPMARGRHQSGGVLPPARADTGGLFVVET